jgi:hypothetical protein
MSAKTGQWYIYHQEGSEMVVDIADHTLHFKQARQAMGLPAPKMIAGTKVPLTAKEAEAYAKGKGLTPNLAPRKPLPEFIEPARWAKIRSMNESARAKAAGKSK